MSPELERLLEALYERDTSANRSTAVATRPLRAGSWKRLFSASLMQAVTSFSRRSQTVTDSSFAHVGSRLPAPEGVIVRTLALRERKGCFIRYTRL